MATSNYSIQCTFQLPAEQIHPLTDGSNDFYGGHGLSYSYFLPIEDQKQPSEAEDHTQQRRKAYHHIIQKLTEGNLPGKEHAVSYLQHQYRRNFKIPTLRSSGSNIRFFLLFLQKKGLLNLEDFTRQDIEAFVEHEQDKGLAILSVKTKLKSLYAFVNYLIKSDILPQEILERKIRLKLPEALPRAIVFEDVKALLAVVTEVRDRAMILLLLRTGMRIGELLSLHVSDINLQELKICIYIGEKNAQGRVVYYCDDAKEALMAWLRIRSPKQRYLFYGHKGRPLSYAGARKVFRKYLEKAGLASKSYTLHQLRHTFASELLNVGLRLEVLQQLLGHSSIEITRHYARLTDKTREEEYFRAMKRIEEEGCESY
ncbi:MAG: tyrosine-type recombinase/integrase [Desulfobulbaceae bacterium]|nr:tyrosine-type recombinase/integrase [Desulfobulbaceae bacterium]